MLAMLAATHAESARARLARLDQPQWPDPTCEAKLYWCEDTMPARLLRKLRGPAHKLPACSASFEGLRTSAVHPACTLAFWLGRSASIAGRILLRQPSAQRRQR